MTIENCIKLLKIYKAQSENPSLAANCRKQSLKSYEDMKAHILKSRKFKGHEILKELQPQPESKDGKKSTR